MTDATRSPVDFSGWKAGLATTVFGVIPVLGLVAECGWGLFSTMLPMFPTGWHAVALGLAVALNLGLHATVGKGKRLFARAAALGVVCGMVALYAVVEAPGLGCMLLLAILGLGLLAASPYIAAVGCLRLVRDLLLLADAKGRPVWQPLALVGAIAAVPLSIEARIWWAQHTVRNDLLRLAGTMRANDAVASEQLAIELRRSDWRAQRDVCANSVTSGRWIATEAGSSTGAPFSHIGDGRPFWFHSWPETSSRDVDDVRIAFHRLHGRAWHEVLEPTEERIVQTASAVTVVPEPEAAIARVDHVLEVATRSPGNLEARFDIRCPPGAVASSLSLWIDGAERPAAFASTAKVTAAYEDVQRKRLDPALLREIAPGRLQLLLFPVTTATSPMRVRVGFTVPMRIRGEHAWLHLPEIGFAGRRDTAGPFHDLRIGESADPTRVDDVQLRQPLRFVRPSVATVAADGNGFVVQDLEPRPVATTSGPRIVVLEASATVGATVPKRDALLDAFPAQEPITLFVAHGDAAQRLHGTPADPALRAALAEVPFTGGVDARAALGAALAEASSQGGKRVLWLHGAAPVLHLGEWPPLPREVEILTFALHPGTNAAVEADRLRGVRRELERFGNGTTAMLDSLAEHVHYGLEPTCDQGDVVRRFVRAATPPAGAVKVGDQVARLAAAWQARALARSGQPAEATALAARHRVITAGAGAVVLENREQYEKHQLDPGAAVGREPQDPFGAGPVPEPSTLLLVAVGLVVMGWRARVRS